MGRDKGLLSVIDVSHTYITAEGDRYPAIRNVSFDIPPGQFCAILGPSGCGKSTLLKIVAGLLRPEAGRIEVDGARIKAPGSDRAMVFQEYAIFPWQTVLKNVEFPLKLRGAGRDERMRIAREYLTLVGLEEAADKYPRQLSGGQRQRVAVARALACEPSVLLMDEPFAALDAITRERLQEELLDIWEATGATVLFVTHSVDEALFLSDRVIVLPVLDKRTDTDGLVGDLLNELPRPRKWATTTVQTRFVERKAEVIAML